MSRFDTPDRETTHKKDNGTTVDGTFACQRCDEICDEATLYPVGDLVWKCSEGHVSVIEEFV